MVLAEEELEKQLCQAGFLGLEDNRPGMALTSFEWVTHQQQALLRAQGVNLIFLNPAPCGGRS